MYSGIVVGTSLLMTILVKYLREKALQKQNIRDQVPIRRLTFILSVIY
jgi:hypothetical protein